jgi:methyl-accepting chemotaxis protein
MVYNLGIGRQTGGAILRNIQYSDLQESGKFTDDLGNQFLYYKLKTEIGDIVVIQESNYSSNYLNIVYIILSAVFLIAIVSSTILISFLGKRFTRPILKLQKASYDIAQGNFNIDTKVDTHDEIEDLSKSINA